MSAVPEGIIIYDPLNDLFSHLPQGGLFGDIVFTGNSQIIFNKDLTDPSNQIRATQLATTGADVFIDGSNPPPGPGYVLTSTSPTTAEWIISGSASIVSNVGTSGVGIYRDTTLGTINLKKIRGTSRIPVVDDILTSTVLLDVSESNLLLQNLGGVLSIAKGGTGATTADGARTNLGIGKTNSAAIPPTVTDDSTQGYTEGSIWVDTVTNTSYILVDATPAAAIWTPVSSNLYSASNVNTGGVGVFKQLTGNNFEFKGINSASSKISIFSDVVNNEIDIDVVENQINHDSLLNYSANRHIDHSAVSINAGVGLSGGGNITTTRTLNIDITTLNLETVVDGANDLLILYDASTSSHKKIHPNDLPITGSVDSASNVNVGGVGVFKQLTGSNLEFYGINAASNKISVSLDAPNNEIDLNVIDSQIDHDSLLNFVANEHIDHSAVSINTGTGLSGGGDITTTRTLNIDVPSLTLETAVDSTNDFLLLYDASAVAHRKIHPSAIPYVSNASNVGVGGIGPFKQLTGSTLEFRNINAASSKVSVALDAPNNEIDIDVVEAQINHNSLLNYSANRHIDHSAVNINTAANSGLAGGGDITTTRSITMDVNNLVIDASPDFSTDYVPTYDASATTTKKILLSKLTNIDYTIVTGSTTVTVSSTTYFTIPSMTVTPAAGTWKVIFLSTGEGDTNNREYRYGVFKNGTLITDSYRSIRTTNNAQRFFAHAIGTQAVVTVNGTDVIDIRFSVSVAASTFTVYDRSMIVDRVSQ